MWAAGWEGEGEARRRGGKEGAAGRRMPPSGLRPGPGGGRLIIVLVIVLVCVVVAGAGSSG